MTKAAIDADAAAPEAKQPVRPAPKKHKLSAFLVTGDVDLWPQIGTHLTAEAQSIGRSIPSMSC